MQSRSKSIAIALLALIVLLAPALLNRGPIYWHDSLAYLHGGSSAISVTTGLQTRYTVMERAIVPQNANPDEGSTVTATANVDGPAGDEAYRITMARSPYYSVFLTSTSVVGGPFAPVLAQAMIVAAAGFFLLRALFADHWHRPALYLAAITAVSGTGLFCAVLLPDFLAPLGIVATAALFGFYDRMAWTDRSFWVVLLTFSVISHTSHLAVTFLLIPFGLILALFKSRTPALAPAAMCAACVMVGVLSIQVFSFTVKSIYGYEPRALPMIAASIIVDGTGLKYLQETCPENGYVFCDHIGTQAKTIDQFLWFEDPAVGVYLFEDETTRQKMTDQQFGFLLDTLRYDFFGQFSASWERFIDQLKSNSTGHLAYSDRLRDELDTELPEPDQSLAQGSAAYLAKFPFGPLGILSQFVSYSALLALIALAISRRGQWAMPSKPPETASRDAFMVFAILVVLGIIANSGITGIVSNPQGRYGARVIWLLPVLAVLWLTISNRPRPPLRIFGS